MGKMTGKAILRRADIDAAPEHQAVDCNFIYIYICNI